MMKLKYCSLTILISLLCTFGCENFLTEEDNRLPNNENKITIQQGVWGNVWFWEGNFMPIVNSSTSGKITAVQRFIGVYEATRFDSVVRKAGEYNFIKEIKSKFICQVSSDKDGFFQIALSPGKYSFFVKEDSLYFANESDGEGFLMPATVYQDSVVKRQININYKAVY